MENKIRSLKEQLSIKNQQASDQDQNLKQAMRNRYRHSDKGIVRVINSAQIQEESKNK